MEKYILFGAGQYAENIIKLLGEEYILCVFDNNPMKCGKTIKEIPIYCPNEKKEFLKEHTVILCVSPKHHPQIISQLRQFNVRELKTIQEIEVDIIKKRLNCKTDYLAAYRKSISWIQNNTIEGQAIICSSDKNNGYPEVTGYYIPTLLKWGYKDLAVSFAKWLCNIQKKDGCWYDSDDRNPYIFDTAQILKGLLAIRNIYPKVTPYIIKGCDWIISNINAAGKLITPTKVAWGNKEVCSELVHLYCLSPLVQAADALNFPLYKIAAYKILDYYKTHHYDEILNFGLLSHFYAYVMEALLDMGEIDMASEAMSKVAKLQKDSGAVPAYHNVDWVCSTGLFQFALVWFRLGDIERGNKAFEYACKLQNESGGWYGSYLSEDNPDEDNDYFPSSEISWAVKYFLDALYYKNIAEFNLWSDSFLDQIDKKDGRYLIIKNTVSEQRTAKGNALRILDVGCGKGRYLKNLLDDYADNEYHASDLSEAVMKYITKEEIYKKQGTLTNIAYPDHSFDITYTCEALEYAVDVKSAIREMARVTKPGGKIVIVDKNKAELGRMEICDWEVWFDAAELKELLSEYCSDVKVIDKIEYEQKQNDNLFLAWIGTVHKEERI